MAKLTSLSPSLGVLKPRFAAPAAAKPTAAYVKRDNSEGRNKTARWQKLRQKILKRDGWRCQQTGVLVIGKYPKPNSAVVDHIKPHRGDEALFWDESNLQTVSKEYHDKTKQKLEQRGRYG